MLVEYCDAHLCLLRGAGYLRRYVHASGDALPERGPVMFVGSHHGCGYWLLPYARDAGFPPSIVAPKPGPLLQHVSLLEHLFWRLRFKLLAQAAGTPLVVRGEGRAARELDDLLMAGKNGFGLCDMPTQRTDAVEVTLAGRNTKLAQNLFELAHSHKATIMLFHSDTDFFSGQRHIRFQRLPEDMPPDECTRQFAALVDAAIHNDPSGWRFWSIAPSFFPELAETPASQANKNQE